MKAIQSYTTFTVLSEAQSFFEALATQEGFIGGRVTKGHFDDINVQIFFECDQDSPVGEIYEGSPERVFLIMESQIKALGIGNPYSQLSCKS